MAKENLVKALLIVNDAPYGIERTYNAPDRLDHLGGEGGELLIGRRAAGRGCAQPCEQNTL